MCSIKGWCKNSMACHNVFVCKEERAQHCNTPSHPSTPKKEHFLFLLTSHSLPTFFAISFFLSLIHCHPPLCHFLSGVPSFFSLPIHLLSPPFCFLLFNLSSFSVSAEHLLQPFLFLGPAGTYSGMLMLLHNN